jgi:hypothetical protein
MQWTRRVKSTRNTRERGESICLDWKVENDDAIDLEPFRIILAETGVEES